jgi:hypothetical protein
MRYPAKVAEARSWIGKYLYPVLQQGGVTLPAKAVVAIPAKGARHREVVAAIKSREQ